MLMPWLLVVVLLITSTAAAQTRPTTGDVTGVVYDEQRAVLQAATVTATNTETNQVRSALTDAVGRFALLALPPGRYTVKAGLAGFSSETQQDVVVQLGTEVALDFTLTIASTEERITVFASPLDTLQTAIASVVTQQQMDTLPINGRNFISFAVITPGVTNDNTPQQGASATSGLTFGGQRARSNNITVDGVDNNDLVVGSVRATFSQEAVREFQVITNSYTAEYGKASGGVVNIVTKSGTNEPSGNTFFFFRHDALNAKEYFERFTPAGTAINRAKAPYRHQQFGATFGGPLRKDRTFFFGSFERLDVTTSNFVTIDDTTLIPVPGQAPGTVADILRRTGLPVDTGNVPYLIKSNAFLFKVDHQVSNANLAFRYNYGDGLNENIEPWGGLVARSRGAALDSTDHMFSATHTAAFKSNWVNEARFQYARRDQRVDSLDPNCGGPCTNEDQGGPTVEILGVASVGRQRFTPQPRLNDRIEVVDTLSLLRGNHQVKVGIDFSYVDHERQALPLHFGGRYLFGALPTIPGVLPVAVNGIQALALGIPSAYIQGYGRSVASYGYSDVSLFAQDHWRATDSLTLKFGLRYQNQFWPDTVHKTPGVPAAYSFPRDNNNLAPRLAVSWDPTGSMQTVVHAAYGVYYDNTITGTAAILDILDGSATGVRTLATRLGAPGPPVPILAWNSPRRMLPETAVGSFPSVVFSIDPDLETPYAHHFSVGVDRQLPGRTGLMASYMRAHGFNQLGTIDYNPVIPSMGAGRRPLDVGGVPGTSASVLQYSGFGETWYEGLVVSATRRFSERWGVLASYTLSKATDTSTDFQSTFLPQDNGGGRNPTDPNGLPLGFDPDKERGPSLQDQRHRFVVSGLYVAPYAINISTMTRVESGRPYNFLAGMDLNADGNGGSIPGPDRALRIPGDLSSSVGRNAGTLPTQITVDLRFSRRVGLGSRVNLDAIVEVFNLFNRTNFIDINNIFGTGAYPDNPSPTFGQFQQAGPPRQGQLALKINF
jgi:hypothetical protein